MTRWAISASSFNRDGACQLLEVIGGDGWASHIAQGILKGLSNDPVDELIRLLKRGEFKSRDDLIGRVTGFIREHNKKAKPFR